MKTEVSLKFKLPKEKFEYEIYSQAEAFHEALLRLDRFIFSGNSDINLFDIQAFFNDVKKETGILL